MKLYKILNSCSETVCFFVRSCANEDETDCDDKYGGNEIIILRNEEMVSRIPSKFEIFEECFATNADATFEFHAGGSDGVSCIRFKMANKTDLKLSGTTSL